MLPNKEDILFAGTTHIHSASNIEHAAEGQNLTCFAGVMCLLGGRIFSLEGYVGIADRLTRGYAWEYDSFPVGLLPEIFDVSKCPSKEACDWGPEKGDK